MKTFEAFIEEARYSIRRAKKPNCKVLYHTSNPYFRDKIAQEGLIPQVGDSYSLHHCDDHSEKDLMPGIFLSIGKYDSTYDDDIYEVDVKQLKDNKFFFDPDEELDSDDWFFYTDKIPLSAIKLIYKGTGKTKY